MSQGHPKEFQRLDPFKLDSHHWPNSSQYWPVWDQCLQSLLATELRPVHSGWTANSSLRRRPIFSTTEQR